VNTNQTVHFQDLGKIDYKEAWDYQTSLHTALVEAKKHNRKETDPAKHRKPDHYLLFCEHLPVYTLGKSGSLDNLLLSEEQLKEKEIQFYKINRGGDITYHGPGQVVGYPILDLDYFFTDVHRYVRSLEEMVIRTLAAYDIQGIRLKEYTGVWLPPQGPLPFRKICAIGVHLSRWVTMHGFAFNVNSNLNYFNNIIPCGINDQDKAVTSMQAELRREVDMEEVKAQLKVHFQSLFGALLK
jgi:lipoyl(octanoyl) transferase